MPMYKFNVQADCAEERAFKNIETDITLHIGEAWDLGLGLAQRFVRINDIRHEGPTGSTHIVTLAPVEKRTFKELIGPYGWEVPNQDKV